MTSPEIVPFEDAEFRLIQAALLNPLLTEDRAMESEEHIRLLKQGFIAKNPRTGWIFYDFPAETDEIEPRGKMQVWTGTSPLLRDSKVTSLTQTTLMGFFGEGVIDEKPIYMRIKNRRLKMNSEKLSAPNDEQLPGRELLDKAIEWVLARSIDLAEIQ